MLFTSSECNWVKYWEASSWIPQKLPLYCVVSSCRWKENIWALTIYKAVYTFTHQESGLEMRIFWFQIHCSFHKTILLLLIWKDWCWWPAMISELKTLLRNRFSIVSTALLHYAGICFDIFRMSKNVRPRMLNVTEVE